MPLLKYPGGKERELNQIIPNLPSKINNYYEPFVGGGAVYFAMQNVKKYYINDKSNELIGLYKAVKSQDTKFFDALEKINHNWKLLTEILNNNSEYLISKYCDYRNNTIDDIKLSDLISEFLIQHGEEFNGMFHTTFNYYISNFMKELRINITRKFKHMKKLESKKNRLSKPDIKDNIECAIKSAFYMHFRYLLNHKQDIKETNGFNAAVYLFIRDTCYSSMFRYNASGEFNVPYGGISYNKKTFDTKLIQYRNIEYVDKLKATVIGCEDFYTFMNKHTPRKDDFIFIDPPYDTEFSTYDQNEFGQEDQKRLATYLISECKGMFMVIIKDTCFIRSLYIPEKICANGNSLKITEFDKQYAVSFMNRNNKKTNHLLITNY
jgi:DNA adenine methylase